MSKRISLHYRALPDPNFVNNSNPPSPPPPPPPSFFTFSLLGKSLLCLGLASVVGLGCYLLKDRFLSFPKNSRANSPSSPGLNKKQNNSQNNNNNNNTVNNSQSENGGKKPVSVNGSNDVETM
jgi:hypothetical protein